MNRFVVVATLAALVLAVPAVQADASPQFNFSERVENTCAEYEVDNCKRAVNLVAIVDRTCEDVVAWILFGSADSVQ